jgi:hypothetical protein
LIFFSFFFVFFFFPLSGGQGSTGVVLGFENVAPTSSRNLIRVQWSDSGVTNSYRLGFEGQVDLLCLEETSGTYYYREHLPVVGMDVFCCFLVVVVIVVADVVV